MFSIYFAFVLGYGAVLVLVMCCLFSSLGFASFFKRLLLKVSNAAVEGEDKKADEVFSVLHGKYRYRYADDSSRPISRSSLRSGAVPKYQDHHYFTRLNREKKDVPIRASVEDYLSRERILRKSGVGLTCGYPESLDEAYCRSGGHPYFKDQFIWSPIINGQRAQAGAPCEAVAGLQQPAKDQLRLPPFFYTQTAPAKLRLSRGLCHKSRRKNLATRIKRADLSIIPETRDESEEPTSTNISTRHFMSAQDSPLLRRQGPEC